MGTRAVDRVGNDFPRLVALSHPLLHAHSDPRSISGYSQKDVDVIDLKQNRFRTLPIEEVFHNDYPVLRYIAQEYKDGYLSPIHSTMLGEGTSNLVLTMDEMLRRTPFADRMKRILKTLSTHYDSPVDLEFTARIINPNSTSPDVMISILQCRPQSHLQEMDIKIPKNIPENDLIFKTNQTLPHGYVEGIKYVVFVPPEGYFSLPSEADRIELARAIGKLNARLADEKFICLGPGRWGTTTPDLGLKVGYADIYNTKALIELSGKGVGTAPEPSFGTHFFQDLLEAHIYPLAIYLDNDDVAFRKDFFYNSPNKLLEFLPEKKDLASALRVISVNDYRKGHSIELIMNGEVNQAVAMLKKENVE